MRLKLRPYQDNALARVADAEARGSRRQLGVAATGLGKTVIFSALAEKRGDRALILAHRDELVVQAAGKILEIWPEARPTAAVATALRQSNHPAADLPHGNGPIVGIVKAGADDVHAHVVVGSVQTLARKRRLDRLLAAQESEFALMGDTSPFGLVVVDEAHHAAADTYRQILKAIAAGEPHGPLLLGVTATPDRGDGVGLDDLFQTVVFSYDILWGIRSGYLSDIRGKQVRVQGLDVDDIKTTGGKNGDYQAGDAGRHMMDAGAPATIARAIKRHAKDRKVLVFTPTIAVAEAVAAECVGAGFAAGWVSGETDQDDRRRLLREFGEWSRDRQQGLQVLANCAVLTEGYDEPTVDCVVVARPTKSRGLYVQMIGRGTRKHPDKDHLLVLDVVGASAEHTLLTIPSLFGLGAKLRKKAKDASAGVAELVAEDEAERVRTGEIRTEDVELFHKVRDAGKVAWISVHSGGAPLKRYERPLPQPGPHDRNQAEVPTVVLAQREPGLDVWTAGLKWRTGAKRALIERVPLELAQGVAEDAVRKMTPSSAFIQSDHAWRQRPPSTGLRRTAGKWHITVTENMTAGEVRDAIDERAAKANYRREIAARRRALEAADI